MAMTPQQRNTAVDRALAAKHQLSRLKRSPDFIKKYAANDPDACDAIRELDHRIASGIEVARQDVAAAEQQQYVAAGVVISQDPNGQAQALEAHRQATDALIHDPDFQKRFNAGDAAALQQWRALSVDGTASALGIPAQQAAESAIGHGVDAKVQAEIAPGAA